MDPNFPSSYFTLPLNTHLANSKVKIRPATTTLTLFKTPNDVREPEKERFFSELGTLHICMSLYTSHYTRGKTLGTKRLPLNLYNNKWNPSIRRYLLGSSTATTGFAIFLAGRELAGDNNSLILTRFLLYYL